MMPTWIWAGIAIYLLIQIGIGFWASRFIKNEHDFILAGRSLGVGLVGISLFANWFGAETVMGASAAIAESGLAGSRSDPFGYSLCLLGMAFFLAKQLRAREYMTLGDFFRDRYGPNVERLATFIMIPSSLIWAAAQLMAFGQILSVLTQVNITSALFFATTLVIILTFLGGLLGTVFTDLFQTFVLLLGLFILFFAVANHSGGFFTALQNIPPERLSLISPEEGIISRLNTWLIPILGSLVAQEALSRTLAAKTPETAKKGALLASFLYFTVALIPVFIGLVSTNFSLPLDHRDQFLPRLAQTLLNPFCFVIFIGALLSAILSILENSLLTVSSLTAHNILVPLFPNINEKQKVAIARGLIVISGFMAYFIALKGDTIYSLIAAASSFGSAGLLITTLFGLWFKKGNQITSLLTLWVGILSTVIGEYYLYLEATFIFSLILCLTTYSVGMLIEQWYESNKSHSTLIPE